jgi:hypothetical protein
MRFIVSVRTVLSIYAHARRKPPRGRNLLKSSRIIKHTRRRFARNKRNKSLFAHLPIRPLSSVLYKRAAII